MGQEGRHDRGIGGAVSPPSPKKFQDPNEPGGLLPGEAFGPIPEAGSEPELTSAELKSQGRQTGVFFIVCVGLKGLPDNVNAVLPEAIVQICIIHLIRNTFGLRQQEVPGLGRQDPGLL